jgi:hypothetical protein
VAYAAKGRHRGEQQLTGKHGATGKQASLRAPRPSGSVISEATFDLPPSSTSSNWLGNRYYVPCAAPFKSPLDKVHQFLDCRLASSLPCDLVMRIYVRAYAFSSKATHGRCGVPMMSALVPWSYVNQRNLRPPKIEVVAIFGKIALEAPQST